MHHYQMTFKTDFRGGEGCSVWGGGSKAKSFLCKHEGLSYWSPTLDASEKPGGTRTVSALRKQNQQLLGLSGQPAWSNLQASGQINVDGSSGTPRAVFWLSRHVAHIYTRTHTHVHLNTHPHAKERRKEVAWSLPTYNIL